MRQLQQSCYGYSGWTAAGRSITFYVAGIAVLNSLWIAALYLLVNVLTNLEESKDLWKEWNRWLKMRSKR